MQAQLVAASAAQGGVFTAAQAMQVGYTRDEIRARLRSRRWVRVRRGIFRVAGDVDHHRVAIAAAVLACRRVQAAASHTSAAHLHGIPLLEPPARVELTVPAGRGTTAVKGCTVHHGPLDPFDVQGPIRVTTPARTVVDLGRALDFLGAVVATDHVLSSHVDAHAALVAAARPFRGAQRHAGLERVLGFASGRSGSVGESVARVVMAEQGLPPPLLGEPVHHRGELLGVVDFLWPRYATVAEFDGRLKYAADNDQGPERLWQEKLREDRLRDAGFEVVRVTWHQVRHAPREVAERVRAAFSRALAREIPRFAGP